MKARFGFFAPAKSRAPAMRVAATRSDETSAGRICPLELEFDHPELAALIYERNHAQGFVDQLAKLHVSFGSDSPDLWVGLSIRLRKMIAAASIQSLAYHGRMKSQLPARAAETSPLDPTPQLLGHDASAVEALGQWRAGVQLLFAARCLSLGNPGPRVVLQTTRDSLVAHASNLDATIGRLATKEILERDPLGSRGSIENIFARVLGARVSIRAVLLREDQPRE